MRAFTRAGVFFLLIFGIYFVLRSGLWTSPQDELRDFVPAAMAAPPPSLEFEEADLLTESADAEQGLRVLRVLSRTDDAPLSGATVSVDDVQLEEIDDGVFALENSGEERLLVEVERSGYECFSGGVEFAAEATVAIVRLGSLNRLDVLVVGTGGDPIADTIVLLKMPFWTFGRCRLEQDGGPFQRTYETVTDADGVAVFDRFVPGPEYEIFVGSDRVAAANRIINDWQRGTDHTVMISAERAASVHGRILDTLGDPGEGFVVRCIGRHPDANDSTTHLIVEAKALCSPDGTFRFDGLASGYKRIVAERSRPAWVEACVAEVTIREGEDFDCGVMKPSSLEDGGGVLQVRVIDPDGAAVGKCQLSIDRDNPEPLSAVLVTDENGFGTVPGLSPGIAYVTPRTGVRGGYSRTHRANIEAGVESLLVVQFKRRVDVSQVKVTVTREDGKLFEQEERFLAQLEPVFEHRDKGHDSGSWSSHGNHGGLYYTARDLAAGRLAVSLIGHGWISRWQEFETTEGVAETNVVLERARVVRGVVVDKISGKPIQGAKFRIWRTPHWGEEAFELMLEAESDDGRFELATFAEGEDAVFEVLADAHASRLVRIEPEENNVTIALDLGEGH